jgi:hypothetical protein
LRQSSPFVFVAKRGAGTWILELRADIEQRRWQIARLRKEILDLQRAGISKKSAEDLLARMLSKVDELCAARECRGHAIPDAGYGPWR